MPVMKKYYWCVILFLIVPWKAWCQPVESTIPPASLTRDTLPSLPADTIIQRPSFVISNIIITGNKKTKPYIIERELPFKRGDSVYLPELVKAFQRSRELLINTRLFNEVIVSLKSFRGYMVEVSVEVKERWYIFPIPYFRPVDRNLTAWQEKNYSLSRVNYGLKFSHNNFTGRNDRLRLWLITGYTRQVTLNYDQPYADKTLKHGFGVGVTYFGLKELNLATVNNQQFFVNADSLATTGRFLTQNYSLSFRYYYRPAMRTRHSLRLSFVVNKIDSIVTVKNPYYFNDNKRQIFYPELNYTIEYQNVDYVPYILRGLMWDVNFVRRGINADMNLWQLAARATAGYPMGRNYFFGIQGFGMIKLPLEQPYINQQLFGYGDTFLRGLEKYVIEGVAGGMVRTTIRKQLFNFSFPSRLPTLPHIPLKIYIKTYGDLGYAYNRSFKQNSLVNTPLYTGGFGIDFVSAYDLILRFEYDFNQLGQQGLFFNVRNEF